MRAGEKLLPDCVQKKVKLGGGKVMLWECSSAEGAGPLIQAKGKMNQTVYKNILIHDARPML